MDIDGGMSSENEWSLLFYRIRVLEPFPTEFILYKNRIPRLHQRCNGAVGVQLWGLVEPILKKPAHIFCDQTGKLVVAGKPNHWNQRVLLIFIADGEILYWDPTWEDSEIPEAPSDWRERYRLQWTRCPAAFEWA